MKVRSGFVSNSSTSSFLVMGDSFDSVGEVKKALTPDKLKEIEAEVEKHNKENPKWQTTVDDWLSDCGCHRYYGDDSLVFGVQVGSVDYIDEIASIESLNDKHKDALKLFEEYFGKEHKFNISLWGIRAEC